MRDGWHVISGERIYVEGGCVVRGMTKDHNGSLVPAHAYRLNRQYNCWVREYSGLTVAAFRAGIRRGTIQMM